MIVSATQGLPEVWNHVHGCANVSYRTTYSPERCGALRRKVKV
jgi:hypothetical protein